MGENTLTDLIDSGGLLTEKQAKRFMSLVDEGSVMVDEALFVAYPMDRNYCIIPDDKPGYGHSELLWWRDRVLDEMWGFLEPDFECEHCDWRGNLALGGYVVQHVYYNEWDKPQRIYMCPRCKRRL